MPGVTTAYQTGVHGSRPAASAGCILYSCTTHSLVYRSDGSTWTTFLTLSSFSGAAADVTYDNTTSGLTATDVQDAIDELEAALGGGGGLTQAYVGYNTAGASNQSMNGLIYAKKVTLANDCLLTSIEAYMKGDAGNVGDVTALVYSDVAGTPGLVIAYEDGGNNDHLFLNTSPRWLAVPIGKWLTAADYWIAFRGRSFNHIYYDGSGSDRTLPPGNNWIADWDRYSPTTTTNKFSIRGNTIR